MILAILVSSESVLTYLLTPWHYSPDGHKPPLIRFNSLILVYLRSRWLTCCHNTFSNQPDSTTRAIWCTGLTIVIITYSGDYSETWCYNHDPNVPTHSTPFLERPKIEPRTSRGKSDRRKTGHDCRIAFKKGRNVSLKLCSISEVQ
jgi:hypothetical protein